MQLNTLIDGLRHESGHTRLGLLRHTALVPRAGQGIILSAGKGVEPKRGYKKRDDGVPAVNKDTGRTVRVLPETLQENGDRFEPLPENKAGDPRWRGKPKPPREPARPDKPDVPREPPPAPVRPEREEKPVKPMKEPNEVEPVKPMKEPRPSPPRRWKAPKKRAPTAAAESVLRRYLQALERKP